ncbi:MAG: tRNA (adenosine(37)-N6)-threonylcarbamoyltransferase complex ATPase subunit type 1 TsaE [Phycisphaerae bacterium]|nr:tRNA (adenosine(37)-N6)-threonylcarbamoyltransferase complex ATPase subunit type 1 TsaE [Phycisphaerae bacterium]
MSGTTLDATSERDMRRIGECVAAGLQAESAESAIVVAIDGELGAGKTRFVGGLAAGLGIDRDAISSPSFVLAMEHEGDAVRLVHIDAWRIGSSEELVSIGWDELLRRPKTVIAVEWASKIESALPRERVDVSIEHAGDTERRVHVRDERPGRAAAMANALAMFTPGIAATKPRAARCSICGKPSHVDEPSYPFCSPRCRQIDLGRWLKGDYRVSRPADAPRDEED